MPRYRIILPYVGEPLPEKIDRSPFQAFDGTNQYELSRVPEEEFLDIRPIKAEDPEVAYAFAFRVVNGCLNRLCVEHNHRTSLRPGYCFENLDDHTDRGSRGFVRFQSLGEGLRFPEVIRTDGGCRSAAFFRRAQIENDPVDRLRYFSLAIEEAGKRIKLASKINKGGEADVIRYTIGTVFKKVVGQNRLKEIRDSISNDHFSNEFKDGRNSAEGAMGDFLYQHVRCLVMHAGPTAKKGTDDIKDTYAPFDPDDWRKASEVIPVVEEVARHYVVYDLS